jgi:hypothetical protein
MTSALAVALVAAASIATGSDTTIAVNRGSNLSVRNFTGDIHVRTWERNAVRVRSSRPIRTALRIASRGPTLLVESPPERDGPPHGEYHVVVPRWMAVELSSVNSSATVRGLKGDLTIHTVRGMIDVDGGEGVVSLSSVLGPIRVIRAHGRVQINSVNGSIQLDEISGRIFAETVNGPIDIDRVVSDSVDASTVNGNLSYDGTLRAGGRYRLTTHSGNIVIGMPEQSGATVSVATFNGEFESDFPITIRHSMGKRMRFKLGKGEATLDLESFLGKIRLRRPEAKHLKKAPSEATSDGPDFDPDPDEEDHE